MPGVHDPRAAGPRMAARAALILDGERFIRRGSTSSATLRSSLRTPAWRARSSSRYAAEDGASLKCEHRRASVWGSSSRRSRSARAAVRSMPRISIRRSERSVSPSSGCGTMISTRLGSVKSAWRPLFTCSKVSLSHASGGLPDAASYQISRRLSPGTPCIAGMGKPKNLTNARHET